MTSKFAGAENASKSPSFSLEIEVNENVKILSVAAPFASK